MIIPTSTNANTKAIVNSILKSQTELYKSQQKATTQKNVMSVSDDPRGASVIMSTNQTLNNIDDYKANITTLDTQSSMLDSIYSDIFDKLERANTLAISAANGTNSSKETMSAIYSEVKGIKEDIMRVANTQYNGEYMFSGANSATVTYTLSDDGSITYNGTKSIDASGAAIPGAKETYERKLEVSKDTYISVNQAGDAIFGYCDNTTDPPTGTGVFYTLTVLENAMNPENYDQDAIRAELDNLQSGITHVSSCRTQNGVVQSRLQLVENSLEDAELLTTAEKSDVQDVDVVEAYSKLTQDYYAYQASMQVASQTMGLSLLNYM